MTRAQLAVIHKAKAWLRSRCDNFDEAAYRELLRHAGSVESAKDLDFAGFAAVMEYFNAWGFRSTWMQRTYGERPGMASPRQVKLIRALWREYTGADDEAALNKWMDRHFKVSALRFATPDQAQKAITGLRRMVARKAAAGGDRGEPPSPAA